MKELTMSEIQEVSGGVANWDSVWGGFIGGAVAGGTAGFVTGGPVGALAGGLFWGSVSAAGVMIGSATSDIWL